MKNPNCHQSKSGKCEGYLIGLSSYLPDKILTNQELVNSVATSDEWIKSRTGIAQRHIARAEESTSDMAIKAAKLCLDSAQVAPEEIQLIILATMTGDYLCPSTANLVAESLACKNAGCYDLNAACNGFIYALASAKAFVTSGMYGQVMVICSEKMSSVIDYSDRNTCVLFGDGAAACLVTNRKKGWRILGCNLESEGSGVHHLKIPAGGSREPTSAQSIANRDHFLKMNGKEVFKQAILRMRQVSDKCLENHQLTKDQIDWFIYHQANARILDALRTKMGIEQSKIVCNLDRVGNTSAASIPLALCEIEDRASQGDLALLASFGAGFSWAASLLQRAESQKMA